MSDGQSDQLQDRKGRCIVRHRLLVVVVALAFGLLPAVQQNALANEVLTQISSDPYTNTDSQHKTQVEPDTFAFGNTIVSAFQSGRFFDGGASNIGFATSTDSGATWTHGFLPSSTVNATPAGPYKRASDPSVAYDAKHNVWLISWLGITVPEAPPVDVLVSRSTDGGLTWGAPVIINNSGNFNDKNWTVCDDTPASPFYGHCYTEWDDASNGNLLQMSTSANGGLSWGSPKTTADRACVIGGQPLVQPNGTVIVPIDDCFEGVVLAFRSTDGGASWSRVVLIAQNLNAFNGVLRSPPLPSAEIDRSGKVYVVWDDCRFEPSCSANDIVMSTSTDGIHWSLVKRIPINPIGSNVNHFIPGLAVDRSTSGGSAHLGLAYYYYPNNNCTGNPTTCQMDVGFISSINGGNSWSAPEQLAGPMSVNWLANTNQGRMVGDYISTSILPSDEDATPVFEVAFHPTGGTACDLSPIVCHENTYTAPEGLSQVQLRGGSVTAGPNEQPVVSSGTRKPSVPQTAN